MDEPENRKTETDKRNIFIVRNLINGAIIFILAVFYEDEYPERLPQGFPKSVRRFIPEYT